MFFCHFFKRLPQITEFRCSGDTAYCLWSYFTKTFRIFQAKYRNCTKYFRLFLGYCGKHGRFGGKAFKNWGEIFIFCNIFRSKEGFVFAGCLCGEFPGGSAGMRGAGFLLACRRMLRTESHGHNSLRSNKCPISSNAFSREPRGSQAPEIRHPDPEADRRVPFAINFILTSPPPFIIIAINNTNTTYERGLCSCGP